MPYAVTTILQSFKDAGALMCIKKQTTLYTYYLKTCTGLKWKAINYLEIIYFLILH